MSVLAEATTIVIRRSILDASWPGGADSVLEWLAQESLGARWVVGDENLVAASFMTDEVTPVLEILTDRGLVLVDDGEDGAPQFQDVAIVNALFGLAVPCEWLEWHRPAPGVPYAECWLAGTEADEFVIPAGHEPGRDAPFQDYVRWDPDMVSLGRDQTGEYWLNTASGNQHRLPLEPLFSEPGPVMAPLLRGFLRASRVQDVHLAEGDAEELRARVRCGSAGCDLRIRAYESQSHFRAELFLPVEVPGEYQARIKQHLEDLPPWYFDAGCELR